MDNPDKNFLLQNKSRMDKNLRLKLRYLRHKKCPRSRLKKLCGDVQRVGQTNFAG